MARPQSPRSKDILPKQIRFGQYLRDARVGQGYTLLALGTKCMVCPKVICNIELAKYHSVNFKYVVRIARGLGLDLNSLAEMVR